ncbi:MAG: hypothetical protein IKI37_06895 [Oscillospiraceae bacterium]|nr:hypothetical protein [Oscillospiraceae bacterium]MBR7084885.1 hypothetical protein [Oscillospiraceae bacterium]
MLKELYHGKISPSEQKMKTAPEKTQEWLKLSEEFEQTLTPEQTEMYHKLSDMQSENASLDNEVLYIQGFKDGALMMMEILGE